MFHEIASRYHTLAADFYRNADPRADRHLLMYSWWPTAIMCLAYVVLVHCGKSWMRSRTAWEIRSVMVYYNVAMVAWSAYLVYEFMASGWWGDLSFGCEVVDTATEGKPVRMIRVGYLFYLTKLVEMLDTAFFVVRKRFDLITFLHIFHHAAMPASVWFGIKFAPGGSGSFYAMVNSVVHIFMYAYYGLAAAGPAFSRYLWWKPLMTVIQMTQFILFIVHNHQFIVKHCDYPFHFSLAIYIYAWIFLILFLNYFIRDNFMKKKKRPTPDNHLKSTDSQKLEKNRAAQPDKSATSNGYSNSVDGEVKQRKRDS